MSFSEYMRGMTIRVGRKQPFRNASEFDIGDAIDLAWDDHKGVESIEDLYRLARRKLPQFRAPLEEHVAGLHANVASVLAQFWHTYEVARDHIYHTPERRETRLENARAFNERELNYRKERERRAARDPFA